MYLGRNITVDLAGGLKGKCFWRSRSCSSARRSGCVHAVRVDNARRRLQKLVRLCAAGTRQRLESASATKPCAVLCGAVRFASQRARRVVVDRVRYLVRRLRRAVELLEVGVDRPLRWSNACGAFSTSSSVVEAHCLECARRSCEQRGRVCLGSERRRDGRRPSSSFLGWFGRSGRRSGIFKAIAGFLVESERANQRFATPSLNSRRELHFRHAVPDGTTATRPAGSARMRSDSCCTPPFERQLVLRDLRQRHTTLPIAAYSSRMHCCSERGSKWHRTTHITMAQRRSRTSSCGACHVAEASAAWCFHATPPVMSTSTSSASMSASTICSHGRSGAGLLTRDRDGARRLIRRAASSSRCRRIATAAHCAHHQNCAARHRAKGWPGQRRRDRGGNHRNRHLIADLVRRLSRSSIRRLSTPLGSRFGVGKLARLFCQVRRGRDAESQGQAKFRQASRLKRIPLAPHVNAASPQPPDS